MHSTHVHWSAPLTSWNCDVFYRYSGFHIHRQKNMQIELNFDSELPVGVNVSVNACLSLQFMLALWLTAELSSLSPNVSWDWLQLVHGPLEDKW